jgi:Flp pilus assembly protein TadD
MIAELAAGLGKTALFNFGKKTLASLSKKEFVQFVLKSAGLQKSKSDFPERYVEALVELRYEGKEVAVMNFFRDESIMQAFYDYHYGKPEVRNNDKALDEKLNHCISALKVGDDIKELGVDVKDEVEHFRKVFNQKVAESMTVGDAMMDRKLDELKQSVSAPKATAQIPHLLTPEPFKIPDHLFFGREKELEEIHDLLFAPAGNLLMLVNGDGGVGKTAVASRYFFRYKDEYTHAAWLLSEKSIANAMLRLLAPLKVQYDERMDTPQKLDLLLAAMANLKKPCLLILDNANEIDDLQENFVRLRQCSNFHLILTTRITNYGDAGFYKIEGLAQHNALAMFEKFYRKLNDDEKSLFFEIREAVGENTLVLELMAKNLREVNRFKEKYSIEDLLNDLQKRGLLRLTSTAAVSTSYRSFGGALRHEKPEDVIAAMYDLQEIDPAETALLSDFAVLPAESIPFLILETLLPDAADLEKNLLSLSDKGWIDFNKDNRTFKCSPVVQELTRSKNARLYEDCEKLIDTLIDKLEHDGRHITGSSYQDAGLFARYAASAVTEIRFASRPLAMLAERIGSYYKITGNLADALHFYTVCENLSLRLFTENKNNVDHKNGLAISYEKLGDTHSALGNLEKALKFFEDQTVLFEELYEAYPQNVSFKNGLAISYSKLGDTHSDLGNLEKALKFFEDETVLFEELYEAYPQNVSFKNGLAISYEKLGDTHSALGNLEKALKFFEERSRLGKELYEAYPQNVSFKNGLAISYSKLGETHSALGNLEEALKFFEDETVLFEELYEAYPQNVSFKNGLAISYSKLGETHSALGNLEKALKFFEERSRLGKELYEAYPQNVSFKNGLAISYSKLGDTHSDLGNLEKALKFFEDETVLFEELYEAYPQNVSFKNGLAISYWKLGDFSKNHLHDKAKARKYFIQAEKLWEELVKAAPGYAIFKQYLDQVRSELDGL